MHDYEIKQTKPVAIKLLLTSIKLTIDIMDNGNDRRSFHVYKFLMNNMILTNS